MPPCGAQYCAFAGAPIALSRRDMNFDVNPYQPPVDDSAAAPARAPQLDAATAKAIEDKINRLNRNSMLLGAPMLLIPVWRFLTDATPGETGFPLGRAMLLASPFVLVY